MDYKLIKKLIEKDENVEIPEDILKDYIEFQKKLNEPKEAKIFKLTKEKIAETENKIKESRIVKLSMFKDSKADRVIDSLRKDRFIEKHFPDKDNN
jgi:DNA-binding MarR family transcriptional regulator